MTAKMATACGQFALVDILIWCLASLGCFQILYMDYLYQTLAQVRT